MPIRLLYDVDMFGLILAEDRPKTGVFRVIEELAVALGATGECDLTPYGNSYLLETKRYIQEDDRLRRAVSSPLTLHDKIRSRLEMAYAEKTPAGLAPNTLSYRAKTKGLYLSDQTLRRLQSPEKRNAALLAQADIFHSPGIFPFPDEVRAHPSKSLRRFRTVYDIIPLIFPEHCPAEQQNTIQRILDETDEETWAVCISQSARDDFLERAPHADPDKFFLTPLAADAARFYPVQDREKLEAVQQKYNIPKDSPYLLTVCSLVPHKNLEHVVRSFAALVRSGEAKDLNLVLAGGQVWYADSFFSAIEDIDAEIRSRVLITGYVADEDLAALYSGALAFLFLSLYEGFGLPPLEAMQCGTPVIVSNTSSLPEVVGDAGIQLDPKDRDGLAQAMIDIYTDQNMRRQLSDKARERSKLFSWERCARETIQAYKRALA